MKPSRAARWLVGAGHLGLLVVVCGWLWIHPPRVFGIWLALFLIAPLIIPIRGLLQGRPYTYAAMSLVALLYMVIGITEGVANDDQRIWAYSMMAAAAALFLGCVMYVRLDAAERRRENQIDQGQKDVEKESD